MGLMGSISPHEPCHPRPPIYLIKQQRIGHTRPTFLQRMHIYVCSYMKPDCLPSSESCHWPCYEGACAYRSLGMHSVCKCYPQLRVLKALQYQPVVDLSPEQPPARFFASGSKVPEPVPRQQHTAVMVWCRSKCWPVQNEWSLVGAAMVSCRRRTQSVDAGCHAGHD